MGRIRLPRGVFFDRSEMGVHARVADWLRARPGLLWCYVPNGEYRSAIAAKRVKRLGLLPGLSDILIFSPPLLVPGCGTALELKREHGGTLAMHQGVVLNRLAKCGWHVIVAHGYESAVRHLELAGY